MSMAIASMVVQDQLIDGEPGGLGIVGPQRLVVGRAGRLHQHVGLVGQGARLAEDGAGELGQTRLELGEGPEHGVLAIDGGEQGVVRDRDHHGLGDREPPAGALDRDAGHAVAHALQVERAVEADLLIARRS
jgi:hypothetical protein